MTDFDYQWKNLLGKEVLDDMEKMFECNNDRVKEFLGLTGIKPWYKKDSFIKDKICLDAGCGPGRWTCALQKLNAAKVDSFDLSEEAVKRCKKINLNASEPISLAISLIKEIFKEIEIETIEYDSMIKCDHCMDYDYLDKNFKNSH